MSPWLVGRSQVAAPFWRMREEIYMLKAMDTGFATGQAAPAAILGRSFDRVPSRTADLVGKQRRVRAVDHSGMQRLL